MLKTILTTEPWLQPFGITYGEVILHDHNGNAENSRWSPPIDPARWTLGFEPVCYLAPQDREYLLMLCDQ
jgi:hypothetical protein